MKYALDRPRANQYPAEKIINELRRVAGLYNNRRFSRREFDKKSTECKGSAVLSHFGSWQVALDATGLKLETLRKDRSQISNEELFEELGRVWRLLGHRPSQDEWAKVKGKYSYTTYKTRFNGWLNACAAFIEYESNRDAGMESPPQIQSSTPSSKVAKVKINTEEKRNISMKLRYKILTQDNYKCVLCGRSPATDIGVSLHVDHIAPFSQGGKTALENLRTLCNECNLGKGADLT